MNISPPYVRPVRAFPKESGTSRCGAGEVSMNGFITSVLSAVNSNALLKNATPNSVYMAAMMAAALDLPVNQNLGFAYIIPYNSKVKGENGSNFFSRTTKKRRDIGNKPPTSPPLY